jgi:hypothetical protein
MVVISQTGSEITVFTKPHLRSEFKSAKIHPHPEFLLSRMWEDLLPRSLLVELCDLANASWQFNFTITRDSEIFQRLSHSFREGSLLLLCIPKNEWESFRERRRQPGSSSTAPSTKAEAASPSSSDAPVRKKSPTASDERANKASSPGDSLEQRVARQQVAKDFYEQSFPDASEDRIASHLKCIDYSKPVELVDIPPRGDGPNGDVLWQHSFPGKVGSYFTPDKSTTADQLGAYGQVLVRGKSGAPDRVVPREQTRFRASSQAPVRGLQSTASPANDTWSISDEEHMTGGGGIQIMIPHSQHTRFIN